MKQNSFALDGFEKYRKKTRKEVFLEEMDQIIPWKEMTEAIELFTKCALVNLVLAKKQLLAI